MRLGNLRLGHACNSSSTHSVILTGEPLRLVDPSYEHYGHDEFVLQGESSLEYVGNRLVDALSPLIGEGLAYRLARDEIGQDFELLGIDHQSRATIVLPRSHQGSYGWREAQNKVYDEAYVKDLIRFLGRKDVYILGGNDNAESDLFTRLKENNALPRMNEGDGHIISRKDGDWWILFDKTTGDKVRFSFEDNPEPYTQSSTPELVDVKITDYCPFNCPFCYMGSTIDGAKAPRGTAWSVANQLGELGVFEIAMGGGEPTLDPQFYDWIRACNQHDIVPNFTTKSLGWLKKDGVALINESIGSFAFSAEKPEEIIALDKALEKTGRNWWDKVSIQVVEGVPDLDTMVELIHETREQGFRLTILGYKHTGRGADQEPLPYTWLDAIRAYREKYNYLPRISVDTVVTDRDRDVLRELGVRDWQVTFKEGAFSMYVDSVTQRIGPSSYCGPEDMVDYEMRYLEHAIRTNFPFAKEE